MEYELFLIFLLINVLSLILGFTSIILWKKKDIKLFKHVFPLVVFFLIDLFYLISGLSYTPLFVPAILILILGINFRSDEWPKSLQLQKLHKIYIFLLSLTLLPGLSLISLAYALTILTDYVLVSRFLLMSPTSIIIPALVFAGSDPFNAKGQREPEHIIGSGFGFLGSILAFIFTLMLASNLPVAALLGILFSIISLIICGLLFISMLLNSFNKEEE